MVLSSEPTAYRFLEELRWGPGAPPVCPQCGVAGRTYYLRSKEGVRKTRTGAKTAREVWKCGACKQQFSVLTGTILHGTKVSMLTWIGVVAHLLAEPRTTPRQLADRFGVTPETARNMRDRLARAARHDPRLAALGRRR